MTAQSGSGRRGGAAPPLPALRPSPQLRGAPPAVRAVALRSSASIPAERAAVDGSGSGTRHRRRCGAQRGLQRAAGRPPPREGAEHNAAERPFRACSAGQRAEPRRDGAPPELCPQGVSERAENGAEAPLIHALLFLPPGTAAAPFSPWAAPSPAAPKWVGQLWGSRSAEEPRCAPSQPRPLLSWAVLIAGAVMVLPAPKQNVVPRWCPPALHGVRGTNALLISVLGGQQGAAVAGQCSESPWRPCRARDEGRGRAGPGEGARSARPAGVSRRRQAQNGLSVTNVSSCERLPGRRTVEPLSDGSVECELCGSPPWLCCCGWSTSGNPCSAMCAMLQCVPWGDAVWGRTPERISALPPSAQPLSSVWSPLSPIPDGSIPMKHAIIAHSSTPWLLHPSGGPPYTLALPFPFLCRHFCSCSPQLLSTKAVISAAPCARNPLPIPVAVGLMGFPLSKYGYNPLQLPTPISCWRGALQRAQTVLR